MRVFSLATHKPLGGSGGAKWREGVRLLAQEAERSSTPYPSPTIAPFTAPTSKN